MESTKISEDPDEEKAEETDSIADMINKVSEMVTGMLDNLTTETPLTHDETPSSDDLVKTAPHQETTESSLFESTTFQQELSSAAGKLAVQQYSIGDHSSNCRLVRGHLLPDNGDGGGWIQFWADLFAWPLTNKRFKEGLRIPYV